MKTDFNIEYRDFFDSLTIGVESLMENFPVITVMNELEQSFPDFEDFIIYAQNEDFAKAYKNLNDPEYAEYLRLKEKFDA